MIPAEYFTLFIRLADNVRARLGYEVILIQQETMRIINHKPDTKQEKQ